MTARQTRRVTPVASGPPMPAAPSPAEDDLGWQERARCAETDPDAFFPDKGGSSREPKKVCRACEVRTECLEYALNHDERYGIWGGLTERQRRKVKRDRRQALMEVTA